jgi:hypothetical protein
MIQAIADGENAVLATTMNAAATPRARNDK